MDEVIFVFGSFRLIRSQRTLLEGKKPVRLGSRSFEILAALVEHAGATNLKAKTSDCYHCVLTSKSGLALSRWVLPRSKHLVR